MSGVADEGVADEGVFQEGGLLYFSTLMIGILSHKRLHQRDIKSKAFTPNKIICLLNIKKK